MYLLDTHTILWTLFNSNNLSGKAKATISSGEKLFLSIASLWEISIKQSIGKLEIDCAVDEIADKCNEFDISILPIEVKHLKYIVRLEDIHRDPFDGLLIAQAITEGMTIITRDAIIPT